MPLYGNAFASNVRKKYFCCVICKVDYAIIANCIVAFSFLLFVIHNNANAWNNVEQIYEINLVMSFHMLHGAIIATQGIYIVDIFCYIENKERKKKEKIKIKKVC